MKMESKCNSLVSYNSPAGSPGKCSQLLQSTSQQLSPSVNTEQIKLSPKIDGSLSEVSEDTVNQINSLESLVNPPLPSELGEAECTVLRGDAIGNTAYTHRWVLNTLLTITQALPHYLATADKTNEETATNCLEGTHDAMGIANVEKQLVGEDTTEKGDGILELGEDVENAACQLWDMTAEPDVVDYLLSLDVVDILHLAKDIISLSQAPRLTEVVVGVVANLCCQSVGCEKVISHHFLLNSCLTLMHTTDDVPTLIEAFRLLRLLLWHITYRLALQDRSQCPVIIAIKSHESLKEALVFILKNSLSDSLLSAVSEFLEALMYIWLPDDQCYMAAYYADSGLVEGVVEVIRHFLKQWEKSGGQEMPKVVHQGVLILYSFVATPAVHLISSFDQYESLLEPILVSYVEHLAKVESVEELLQEENAERLTYALGLSELLVPRMQHSNILLPVGKLLALTHGASHHYTAIHNQNFQGTSDQDVDQSSKTCQRRISRSRSRRSRTSQDENMETDAPVVAEQKHRELEQENLQETSGQVEDQSSKTLRRRISRSRSRRSRTSQEENMETDAPVAAEQKHRELEHEELNSSTLNKDDNCKGGICKKMERGDLRYKENTGENCESMSLKKDICEDDDVNASGSSTCGVRNSSSSKEEAPAKNDIRVKLRSTVESLSDYCVRVVQCCPDLCAVLTALNECHAHEVQLFFRAVRSRDPKLVGQLQEQLLDTGSHNRLVTILSDMYT